MSTGLVLVVLVAFSAVHAVTGWQNVTYFMEDVPEYEVLHFPSKYEATLRSTKQTDEKPQQQQQKPQQQQQKPQKPQQQQQKPQQQQQKPQQQQQKPQQDQQKPQQDQQKPQQDPQKPQQQQQKPQQDQQKPQQQQSSGPCKCIFGQCTCCTGPILDLIRQKACLKIVYTPQDFSFDYSMMLNNRVMYQSRFSGKNPPPACFSIPRLVSLKVCARFSNVYFAGRNLHVCLGMNGRWESFELFSFSFDCLRMGSDGVFLLKPEDGGFPVGVNGGLDAVIDAGDDIEDYDENLVRSAKENIFSKLKSFNNTFNR